VTARFTAVVVIHEAFGLNDNIKQISDRFADAGYAALAVDLFTDRNRAICMARYMAGMLMGSVNRYGIDDLKSALTFLAKLPEVDVQRMGAIGFCMGGGFALRNPNAVSSCGCGQSFKTAGDSGTAKACAH